MKDFLVLKDFLKDKEKKYLAPEIKIYEIIELLGISKKNYYISNLLTEKISKKFKNEVIIFLIFFFNYLNKGHIRCNLKLLKIDIKNTLEYALINLDKEQENYKILENKIKNLFVFKDEKKINKIIFILRQFEILQNLNKKNKIETPLVLENDVFLYTQKNYRQEEDLIKNIETRILLSNDNEINKQNIIYNFENQNLSLEQINAIKKALESNFFILSGGPGTGKTTVIYYILKAISNNINEEKKVALIAPTGKASQNLKEKIPLNFKNLKIEYKTIHKLLKLSFINIKDLYNEKNPLEFDVVIVDEASMIDLGIFLKLLKALKKNTKLIMIGDKNQLPSINEGNVYSSLIEIKNFNEKNVEILKTNFRSNKKINAFANAISQENEELVLSLIKNSSDIISFKDINKINKDKHFETYIRKLYKKKYNFNLKSLKNEEIDEIFNNLLSNTILSSNNFGDLGVIKINKIIKNKLKKIYGWDLEGQIIMINQNDYKNNLFNGERGISFKQDSKIYILFKGEEKKYKKINFNMLTNYELSFATTIHKSQGSEYKNIQIILEDNPFLTKELFYTAITRAKETIDIVSNKKTIIKIMKNKIERDSKIADYINSTLSI